MTEAKDRIDRHANREAVAPRKVATDSDEVEKSAEEQSREAAHKTFDRIRAARLAQRKKSVKKTD